LLIVEDERDLCELLAEFFGAKGFAVVSAFSGEEALAKLREQPADIVLLDILLPGLSGLEVLRRIKQLYPKARVIMVTSLDQEETRDQAHRYGAAAYITKPFDFSDTTWSPVLLPPVY
jgi:DNA-binding response OmpR family regulator